MTRRRRMSARPEKGCTIDGCDQDATATVTWLQDGRRYGRRLCADHAAGKQIQAGIQQVNVIPDRVE